MVRYARPANQCYKRERFVGVCVPVQSLYAGTCYLGLAMSSMKEPVVKKVHAAGNSREHRIEHKEYFAEQALQMVMEHL